MRTKAGWIGSIVVMFALSLPFATMTAAQTSTTSTIEMKDFEVIAVDGNRLAFRDQTGAKEITVPDDFRFTIDGKKMAVSELKPGMKGTAMVTTTTTVTPVFVTELREADVLRASDTSVTVRGADGNTRRFTQGEITKRSIEIVKDGKTVRVSDLKRGDKLTDKYFAYVGALSTYLEDFMRRTRPLENVDKVLASFDREFEAAWEKDELPGWKLE